MTVRLTLKLSKLNEHLPGEIPIPEYIFTIARAGLPAILLIGRSQSADITLDETWASVSGRHAAIAIELDNNRPVVSVQDLDSRNGTHVSEEWSGYQPYRIQGDPYVIRARFPKLGYIFLGQPWDDINRSIRIEIMIEEL